MNNTSTIHIKTDFDCKVFDFGQELGITKADTYFNVELRKGEHELTFVFIGDESISKTIDYIVKDVDCDYRLIIEIAEAICDKAKEQYDSGNYSTSFTLFSLAAAKGYARAQNRLGVHYKFGRGVEEDPKKAVEWYTKAAEQGDAKAQCNLGVCYEYGTGVEKDLAKAVEWYTKAAEQRNAKAQFNLGVCYEHGAGIEKNLTKAIEWYTKAAEQGLINVHVLYDLGYYYETGDGVEKDLSKAIKWFTKAAEQGHKEAQYKLGYYYKSGNGVEKDLNKAVIWYTKAAEQGDTFAQAILGLYYECGIGVAKDITKAIEFYNKAAKQGYLGRGSQYHLGRCYEYGKGVEKNLTKSIEYYTEAASFGDDRAQYKLGNCYEFAKGIEKDLNKAVEWYTKAAEQGYADAQCNLGICFEKGNGVEKDLAKAVEWYTKAAEQGQARAQCNLGICFEKGNGVEKDLAKAVEWYTKAAEQGIEYAKNALNRLKSIKSEPIHYLFFDTETAGLPRDYNAPTSDSKNWPRLVQLSWITTDEDFNVLSENDYIVYPDGFTIPEDAVRLHGITTNIAKEEGKPIKEVIDKFMEDFNAATTIVGHNIDFDKKIIGAELIRLGLNDIMSSKEALCTMKGSVDYCKIPSTHGYKWPKLQELHKKLFGYVFEDAHNSMSDVAATLKCFKEMKKLGWI